MLNTQSKSKANDYGSVDGQKKWRIQTAIQRKQTEEPIHSAGPTRANQSQAVEKKPLWWCTAQEVSSDMMMINIFQHIKTKGR